MNADSLQAAFLKRVVFTTAAVLIGLWTALVVWALVFAARNQTHLKLSQPPAASDPRAGLADWSSFYGIPGVKVWAYPLSTGETLEDIAARFKIKVSSLKSLNRGQEGMLEKGDVVLIPSQDGAFHRWLEGQTLADVAHAYGISLKKLLEANPAGEDGPPRPGGWLFLPGAGHLDGQDSRWKKLQALALQPSFRKPTNGRLSDGFGARVHPLHGTKKFHEGLDLAPGKGARVFAAQDGQVLFAGERGDYGKLIILDHGGGLTSRYAHLSEITVRGGDIVQKGQVIGRVGATGGATGPHLHFEIRQDGRPQNPLLYLESTGEETSNPNLGK